MKNFLFFLVTVLMLGGLTASAATIDCSQGSVDLAAMVRTQDVCQVGDKWFSNFTSAAPAGTTITFGTSGSNYTINFQNTPTNGFAQSFSLGYTVEINFGSPLATSGTRIVSVSGGMQDGTAFGQPSSATLAKQVTVLEGINAGSMWNFNVVDTNGVITPGGVGGLAATKIGVVDTFTWNQGNITNIVNTITQGQVPEPMTMSLLGAGLLALGVLRRKLS